MRSKKSRHKTVAINFLSSISLDGSYQKNDNKVIFDISNVYYKDYLYHKDNVLQSISPKEAFDYSGKSRLSNGCDNSIYNKNCEPVSEFGESEVYNIKENLNQSICLNNEFKAQTGAHENHHDLATLTDCSKRVDQRGNDDANCTDVGSHLWKSRVGRPSLHENVTFPSKRMALCVFGKHRTVLTRCSILSYSSKGVGPHFKFGKRNLFSSTYSHKFSTGSGPADVSLMLGPQTAMGPNKEWGRQNTLLTGTASNVLSSLRAVCDEDISYAHLLQPKIHRCAVCVQQSNANNFNLLQSDSTRSTLVQGQTAGIKLLNADYIQGDNPQGPISHYHHHHLSFCASQLKSLPVLKQRNASLCSTTGCHVAIQYPDPSIHYIPTLLDDPELLIVTGKRVLKLPTYLSSVLGYTRPDENKREVNREFHERFPQIQLTLTKLRSIKSVMVQITRRLSLDLWIVAHSHVLFEKLILKLFVNKLNRKLCASAALLISAKLNDVKSVELSNLIQEMETCFRISRRELINTELEVSLGLEFSLIPPEWEILPHCQRIHQSLYLVSPMTVFD